MRQGWTPVASRSSPRTPKAIKQTVSFMPDTTGSALVGTLLRGTPPTVARRTAGDVPLPPDFRQGYTSSYELQTETKRV